MNPKNKLPPKPIDLNKAFVLDKNKIYNNPVLINNKTIINLPNIINKKKSNSSISITPILNNKRLLLEDFENNVSNTKYLYHIFLDYFLSKEHWKCTQEIQKCRR